MPWLFNLTILKIETVKNNKKVIKSVENMLTNDEKYA